MTILMIDNYDSFTHNLVQAFENAGREVVVYRNDSDIDVIEQINPDSIVISPGPSNPKNAGISMDVIREYGGKIPIFGVCLGMQAIAEVYGLPIQKLDDIVHGANSEITHDEKTIFKGLPQRFAAARYHSLGTLDRDANGRSVDQGTELEITATTINPFDTVPDVSASLGFAPYALAHHIPTRIVMGLRHKEYPIEGVQFHPESILTMQNGVGQQLIENVVRHYARHN